MNAIFHAPAACTSLYLHFPKICPSRGSYLAALTEEITSFFEQHPSCINVKNIFIAGSPLSYPQQSVLDIVSILAKKAQHNEPSEISIELHNAWRNKTWVMQELVPINRLSMTVYPQLSRRGTRWIEQIAPRYKSFSITINLGYAGMTEKAWKDQLLLIIQLPIDHVVLQCLTEIHRDHNESQVSDLYTWSVAYLEHAGFIRYSAHNFARIGHESGYHHACTARKPYKGFGTGACSFDGIARYKNTVNGAFYCHYFLQGATRAVCFRRELSMEDIITEEIMLGIASPSGIDTAYIASHLSQSGKEHFFRELSLLCQWGFIYKIASRARLTSKGYSLENGIITRLLP